MMNERKNPAQKKRELENRDVAFQPRNSAQKRQRGGNMSKSGVAFESHPCKLLHYSLFSVSPVCISLRCLGASTIHHGYVVLSNFPKCHHADVVSLQKYVRQTTVKNNHSRDVRKIVFVFALNSDRTMNPPQKTSCSAVIAAPLCAQKESLCCLLAASPLAHCY